MKKGAEISRARNIQLSVDTMKVLDETRAVHPPPVFLFLFQLRYLSPDFFFVLFLKKNGRHDTTAKDTVYSSNIRKAFVHILSWQLVAPSGGIAVRQKSGANLNAEKGTQDLLNSAE